MKRAAALGLTALLLFASLSVYHSAGTLTGQVNGAPTRGTVTGNEKNSSGLPQSASFTTVETWDADDDGKYEIYLGGAGRSNPRTQGISAYEFSTSTSSWSTFGSGLPGSSSGEYYGALGLGDVNKDGNLDIVAPIPSQWYATSTNAVEIWTSSSSQAFTKAHTFTPGKSTNQAIVEDLDGDSNPDIVFSYYGGLKAYFGSGSATSWTESSPTANGYEMDGVAAGDLNHDGLMDLVATPYFSTRKIYMYIQGSSRSWSEITFKQTTNEAYGIQIADINGDGDNDVAYATKGEGIKVWCGDGGGSVGGTSFTWTSNSTGLPTSGGDWNQLELGDVDLDSDLDIISISSGQDRARIFINNQPSSWTELFTSSTDYLTVGGSGYGANFVDFDGDSDLDAVACSWGGGIDAYTIHTSGTTPPPPEPNRKPMPDAGEDQQIFLGEPVRLDGTASTDPEDAPDGDTAGSKLIYDWNVTKYPAGSIIRDSSLSPSDSNPKPSFTPDKVGTYEISLRVKDQDGDWSNETDTDAVSVVVIKPNDPPVADAGPDRSVFVDDQVQLDGSGSRDIDGSIVLYEWRCLSHTVTINNDDQVEASFTPDQQGTFVISLRVQDDNGTWSSPDEVLITAIQRGQNLPPTADAGPDQAYYLGDSITLDGSGSMDLDGDIVTWEWTSTSHPSLDFTDPNSSSPSFTPTGGGAHVIQLRVRDDNRSWSAPDTVTITVIVPAVNVIPVANAGTDLSAMVGDLVTLDGRDSYDPDGIIEAFNWTCTSHTVTLMEALTARPSFIPDVAGRYV
ncbi:MAG: PKD domain-containing protein, partial [Thermoplasmatota archaeon]